MSTQLLTELTEVGTSALSPSTSLPVAVDTGPLRRTTLSTLGAYLKSALSMLTLSDKGVANGVAALDASGKVPASQLPAATTGDFIPNSARGTLGGVATLDVTGKVPAAQLPTAGGSIPTTEKGAANGVATLDSGGKVPASQIPASGTYVAVSEKGAASGVATLDSGGKVPTAQLPALGGSGSMNLPNLVTDFGGNGNGIASNDAAITAAEASAYERIWVPEGRFATTKTRAQMSKRYEGPGVIVGQGFLQNYRVMTAKASFGTGSEYGESGDMRFSNAHHHTINAGARSGIDQQYFTANSTPNFFRWTSKSGGSGCTSKSTAAAAAGAMSIVVNSIVGFTNGEGIRFVHGITGDWLRNPDSSIFEAIVSGLSGSTVSFSPGLPTGGAPIGSTVTNNNRTMNAHSLGIGVQQGAGDFYLWCGRVIMDYQATPGQDHFFNRATGGIIGGDMIIQRDGNYVTGWECFYSDRSSLGDADASVIAQVETFARYNDTGAFGNAWMGTFFKSEGSKAADVAHAVAGKWRVAIDTVRADFTAASNAWANTALGQRWIMNSTVSASGRTAASNIGPFYGNVAGDMMIEPSNDGISDKIEIKFAGGAGRDARIRIRPTAVQINVSVAMASTLTIGGDFNLPAGARLTLGPNAWLVYSSGNIMKTIDGGATYTPV